MPIELRRLLIGDTSGDFNFLRYPNLYSPKVPTYDSGFFEFHEDDTQWIRRATSANFTGGLRSLWLRYMRIVDVSGASVDHLAPAFGAFGVVRFGLGGAPMVSGRYVLGVPYTVATITPTAQGYYELRCNQPAQRWRVAAEIVSQSGSAVLDLDEVRLWEYVDIEPYLDELISSQTDTEVFQMPYGRYFSGTHYRYASKQLTVALLVPRSETQFLRMLDSLLTKPSRKFPLELFIDNYLYRCALSNYQVEPVGGALKRVVIELRLLRPYAYHQDRLFSVSTMQYPSSAAPVMHQVTNSLSDVETPCEVRVMIGNAQSGYKVRVTVTPSGQQAVFVMSGNESASLLSFSEDGRVLLGIQGGGTTVEDVTSRLEVQSQVPFVLHPGVNTIIVERLDSNNNPTNDSAYWQIAVDYNPRIGEVVGL